MSVTDTSLLQKHFGIQQFRPGQSEIIQSALTGRDAMAVLPTGGGKSLCYQYPAVHLRQLVLVISPLIALMKDQVSSMARLGIPAGCLHSGQTMEEKRQVFRQVSAGGPYVLYLSPERTQKDGFQTWLKTISLALIAVDEAHCVSQWGHDFRGDYSQLKNLKALRPDVPMLALTASATPFVLNDMARQLGLIKPARHVHGFYRKNLYYQVEPAQDDKEKFNLLKASLQQTPKGRVLVYCGTRKVTEELSQNLNDEFAQVDYYHAGLPTQQRSNTQEAYAQGQVRILIATNAFGMGIDHPDVRLVVHYQMPANIDSLYQEMGRAGRDGQDSTCLLLYAKRDRGLQTFFIQRSKAPAPVLSSRWRALENLVAYAEGGECRHAEILTYYQDSQRIQRCGHCDVCDPHSARRISPPRPTLQAVIAKVVRRKKNSPPESAVLSPDDLRVCEILRLWRREKARELDVPAFVVMSDRTMRHLAQSRPSQLSDLQQIYGFGPAKIERFGQELIDGPLAVSP